MDNVEIYYFSGTGNSLVVARDVAEKLEAKLAPVVAMVGQESVTVEADAVGFVFPIYDFKPPPIVEDFIRKLEDIDSKYLFAICTYGIAPAQSLKHLDTVMKSCGGHLSAGFAVGMPHSGIGSGMVTKAQQESMFENWKDRLEEVCDGIRRKEEGKIESSNLLFDFFQPRIISMVPFLLKFLKQMLFKGTESLAFTSSKDCNGCGICERICPLNNIEMVDDKPAWSDNCVSCFACLNWCPQEAISLGGFDANIKNYHHPEVKISDMLRQRQTMDAVGC
jgi:formate hydrogenlyase subunit 6/NADH:ubiquinone oxidoreductase subunit I/flavodoxin